MQGRTDLQDELHRDRAIECLVDNLYAVKDAFGIEAFAFFLDKNNDKHATGRLFFKVDRSGSNPGDGIKPDLVRMDNASIPLSEATMKHIMGRLDMSANAKEAKLLIGEIADILNQDDRLNKLIDEFEKKYPEQGEKLKDFILGQAAFRLIDKSNEKMIKDVKDSYQALEDVVKQIKKESQGKPSRKQQSRIDELEAKEKPFEREMRKSDALLGMIRKDVVLNYQHDHDVDASKAQEHKYTSKIQEELKARIAADSDIGNWSASTEKKAPAKARSGPDRLETTKSGNPLKSLFSRERNKTVKVQAEEFTKRQSQGDGPKIVIGEMVSVKKKTREELLAEMRSKAGEMPDLDGDQAKKSPGRSGGK